MSRPQVVKRLWEYIREHNLQDPQNRKHILCDARLTAVFRCSVLDMFKMNKLLSQHVKARDDIVD
jgi:upstream activation factor subunit UAF30